MRRVVIFGAAMCLALVLAVPVFAQENTTLLQGTQVKLVLLTGLSTTVAREGDPFIAAVAEPVYIGDQLILPAGTRVQGEVGQISRGKRFSIFRGESAMALYIRSVVIDGREIPAPMSILGIYETASPQLGDKRRDLKTTEGVVVEKKHDVKGDLKTVGLGTGGGTVIGAVFSHLMRGLVIGLVGSTTYVMVKKGKELELPTQTGFLVRVDGTVTLPNSSLPAQPYISGQP